MRSTIEIRGARENNLKGIDVEFPRDRLIVVTGVSGSGKSSLAFETLYAEGQRRLMASMSTFARRFVQQLKKPRVDFVHGLSPVVSIDQKTVSRNPRSTVGTMTDAWDYLRMLYATLGEPHCPDCDQRLVVRTPHQMAEHLSALPHGTEVELQAPAWRPWGEDFDTLFEQIRVHGYRHVRIDGALRDLGGPVEHSEDAERWVDVVIDRFVVGPGLDRAVLDALEHARKIGDGLVSFHLTHAPAAVEAAFHEGFGCAAHHRLSCDLRHGDFTFNDAAGACVTCGGLGRSKRVHAPLLVPDPSRSLAGGALIKEALNNDKNTWGGRLLHSLSVAFDVPLDVSWRDLPAAAVDVLLHGTRGEKFAIRVPEGARQGHHHEGKEISFDGLVPTIERHYHRYRKQGDANTWMEDYLDKVMVEFDCPDCDGARLKEVRRLVHVGGKSLHELGAMHLQDVAAFLRALELPEHHRAVGEIVLRELLGRLDLLTDIGLDYLSLDRRSGTLSGGEAQRIRLSTQIGSGLMGMLYVLDEPSIGLHPKDNVKMIATLRKLVDLGNTVVVVEHDPDTILAADHVVELGPGPGVHGGELVVAGTPAVIQAHPTSPTGLYLSGRRAIQVPPQRRVLGDRWLEVSGARQHNLQHVDVRIPLGALTCITGASGSGKSTLLHDTIHQRLMNDKHDSRVMYGDHDALLGMEHIDDVVDIDQSAIGRSPRSNPATYVGFYDNIRKLFARTEGARSRGWSPSRFSFNVKGGRCEACAGDGTITTKLSFMPDVQTTCPTCKGARYNADTLEVAWNGSNIHEVLEMSIEDGAAFFASEKAIGRKLDVLHELGLGYLTIGHPATLLSGGEAQRVKLASQLAKLKRGKHLLYLLDEPTTGLHLADIDKLLHSVNRLVDQGHTVVVIEHNLEVIKTADWVVDLGPEGGHKGGRVVAMGRPEDVAACDASFTGRFLRPMLS